APCRIAATPPTTTNSAPRRCRTSSVSRNLGAPSITEGPDAVGEPLQGLQALIRGQGKHPSDEGPIDALRRLVGHRRGFLRSGRLARGSPWVGHGGLRVARAYGRRGRRPHLQPPPEPRLRRVQRLDELGGRPYERVATAEGVLRAGEDEQLMLALSESGELVRLFDRHALVRLAVHDQPWRGDGARGR